MNRKYLTRYQDSPWYVRWWRTARYMPSTPFSALYFWIRVPDTDWAEAWDVAVGTAQFRMNWYYTLEEVLQEDRDNRER